MGFFSKLAFWKKDDLGLDKDFSSDFKNMDLGGIGKVPGSDDMGLSAGMPDMTNFRGVGDFNEQQQMNRSIEQQFGNQGRPNFTSFSPTQHYQEMPSAASGHELEVISAKLDAIRANLDAINQRLANLERIAYGEQEQQSRVRW